MYKQTKYRWVILIGCMLSTINYSIAFPTLAPVAVQIQSAYELSSVTVVNLCAISFSLCSAPATFLCIYVLGRFKMSTCMRIASVFQLLGMCIRDMSIFTDSFWPMLIGMFIQSSVTPFFMVTQAQISNRWFPDG